MSALFGERLLSLLHPARLVTAAIGAAAVAAAALATAGIAAALGTGPPVLAMVLGGIIALNVLLFFPQGELGRHPLRFIPILATNVVPLVAAIWLARHQPIAVQGLLVICAGAAALARPFGALLTGGATTLVMNVLMALLLGAAPSFPLIAAIAAPIGCLAGFVADALANIPFGGLGRLAEQALLHRATASFFEAAAQRSGKAGAWSASWWEPDAARIAGLANDMAPSAGSPGPLLLRHLIGAIGRAGRRLEVDRDALDRSVRAMLGATLVALAAAVRRGRTGEDALERLRSAALAAPRVSAAGEQAAVQVLGLWLLLGELVRTLMVPAASPQPPPRHSASVGPTEIRIALQAVVSVAIAILATYVLPIKRPYWIPLTAVILTSTSFGETLRKSYERLLGTIGGLIAGELLWLAFGKRPDAMTAILLLAVGGIFFSRSGAYRWMLAWVTLALVVLLNESGQTALLLDGRLADTVIGLVIVLVVTRFLLPVRARAVAEIRERALLDIVTRALRDLLEGRRQQRLLGELETALAGLRTISDAELLEAGLRNSVRERVRVRLEAAQRIAGVLISFAALPADFRPGPEAAAALTSIAELSEKSAAGVVASAPDLTLAGPPLLARADGSGLIRLDLRVLGLLSVLAETIPALATSTARAAA